MEIKLMRTAGLPEALFGIGLSFGLTSGEKRWAVLSETMKRRLEEIASRLCQKGAGEDKFLRQVQYWFDVRGPRYWWCEADTFKVGTVAQSESTMHRITGRPLDQKDFEEPVDFRVLMNLNGFIEKFNESKGDQKIFLKLKNALPEGYLQRRIWSVNLANMKNIHAQRVKHRLPQWHEVCKAFVKATPEFLRGMYRW